jgi:hypothetical protein
MRDDDVLERPTPVNAIDAQDVTTFDAQSPQTRPQRHDGAVFQPDLSGKNLQMRWPSLAGQRRESKHSLVNDNVVE